MVHLVEGGLDVADSDLLGDEGTEVEAALLVEVDEHREVSRRQAVAVPAGLQRPAPAEHVDERDVRDLGVGVRDADEDDGARKVAGVEGLLPRLRDADGGGPRLGVDERALPGVAVPDRLDDARGLDDRSPR